MSFADIIQKLFSIFFLQKDSPKEVIGAETESKPVTQGVTPTSEVENMTYQELLKAYGGKPYWWKWKNFEPKEMSCKCDLCGGEIWQGNSTVPPDWFIEAMDNLQRLRDQWGKPIIINSAHRCKVHNAEVNGVANSQHLTHIAFDCRCEKKDQRNFVYIAQNAGFKFYKYYDTFVHLDMRVGK